LQDKFDEDDSPEYLWVIYERKAVSHKLRHPRQTCKTMLMIWHQRIQLVCMFEVAANKQEMHTNQHRQCSQSNRTNNGRKRKEVKDLVWIQENRGYLFYPLCQLLKCSWPLRQPAKDHETFNLQLARKYESWHI